MEDSEYGNDILHLSLMPPFPERLEVELVDYYFGARDPNRFLMSVDRDIQLVPRQQGAPINIFFYPYVEVDGEEFLRVETEFRFRDLQQEGVV